MKNIKYLLTIFLVLICVIFYGCQQENVVPDVAQGTDVAVTAGDPLGDPDGDDDDGDDDD